MNKLVTSTFSMYYFFQMPNVKPDQADTYKCFAINEYGQAVVTVVLNVIEGKNSWVAATDIIQ